MEHSVATDGETPEQASTFCRIAVVLFTLSYITFALWLLVDLWVRDKSFVTTLLSLNKESLDVMFVMALYSVIGALLGSGVLDLVSFHKYAAVENDFRLTHVPGYIYGPWLAATVGLIIFCLLQSGLFVFSGGGPSLKMEETPVSKMAYISVGFLAGFGWMNAVEKIREIVSRFFAKDVRRKKKEPEEASSTEAVESAEAPAENLISTRVGVKKSTKKNKTRKKKPRRKATR